MQALGALSPIDTMRGQLQEKIADFLAARARLQRIMKNPSLQVQGQANGLYAVQVELENQLQNIIYPKLTAIQSGVWDFSDIALLGGFTLSITKQVNDVNSLVAQTGGQASYGAPLIGTSTMLLGIPLLVMLGLAGGFMFARR